MQVIAGVELVFHVPAIGFEFREIVYYGMEIGENKGKFFVVGMSEVDSILLAEVSDLIFDAHGLLDEIFMAVVGYLLVETLEFC